MSITRTEVQVGFFKTNDVKFNCVFVNLEFGIFVFGSPKQGSISSICCHPRSLFLCASVKYVPLCNEN